MDPIQVLKNQIGELVWVNAQLMSQVDKLTKEIADLKKEDTNAPNV